MTPPTAMPSSSSVQDPNPTRRPMLVGKGWVQGVVIVLLFSFTVMGILVYRTYTASMPVPDKVVSSSGEVLFTHADITAGQDLFNNRGLMEFGSVMGHGGYLGPDFTTDYLHRAATITLDDRRADTSLRDPEQANIDDWRTNRYDKASGVLTFSDEQVKAYQQLTSHYADYFGPQAKANGLMSDTITDPTQIHQLTSFFAWTAWASAAQRPGKSYTYTNNWPSEPLVANSPTADLLFWSAVSLIVLLGGTGILFAIYGRWSRQIGWHSEEAPAIAFRQPDTVGLTPAQRATAWFFLVIAVLFLAQTLVGAAAEHYRADLGSFFGFDLASWLPFNLARTWHVQLSLFWTAAGFLAAGIFLTPMIAGREPKRQGLLTYILLGAVAVVVFGSLGAEMLSIRGVSWASGPLFGQQWEYLDLPKVFQALLTLGMFLWIFIVYRGIRGRLRTESRGNMPWLFFFSALSIPMFYAVGLLAGTETPLSVAEFWRFWVVHLWVEDFLELFTTVMVAYIFVMLGVVRERIALGIIFMDVILYSAGGVLGTMHHLYFSGTPVEHMAIGAFFSAAEVIPLTFLTVEAWAFMQLGARQESRSTAPFPHRWAVMFLVSVGFWNFVGAGIFGFLINLPIVSYYEIGTALTANHGHAAMMGVYGMLSVGLSMFALRYLVPEAKWPDKLARISFWSLNIGLAWMVFATLLPLGLLQFYHSMNNGYYDARTLNYITSRGNALIEWGRMPGDLLFIIGGVLPFAWIALQGVLNLRAKESVDEMPADVLFTEVEPEREPTW